MTGHRPAESPCSEVSYAGFPVSKMGLQCPVCAYDATAFVHFKDGHVEAIHQLMRTSRDNYDVWKCVVQHGKKGTM